MLDPTALATYFDAGATPSERIIPLEDPTITDVGAPASVDDTPVVLPDYNPDLIPSARPGNRSEYEADKTGAWNAFVAAGEPNEPDPTVPGDTTGVEIGPHAAGMEGIAISPSDSTLALGRTRVVQMVNKRIAVYKKSDLSPAGGPVNLQDFVHLCIENPDDRGLGDPQILWDNETRRWYYVVLQRDITSQTHNCLAFGWSKSPSPTPLNTNWCHFTLPITQLLDDYPKLGDNRPYIIIGSNRYSSAHQDADYRDSRLQVVKKPPRRKQHSCASPQTWTSPLYPSPANDPTYPITPVPANAVNAQAEGWAVGIDQSANKLWIWRVRRATSENPCGNGNTSGPCFHSFKISLAPWEQFFAPTDVPQAYPYDTLTLNTGWGQPTQAVALWEPAVSKIAVWTQHTVGIGGTTRMRARLRWYEIIPSQPADPFRQRSAIVKSQHWVFNGAISPAANGRDAVIQYNWGGGPGDQRDKVRISARARTGSTPLGTWGSEQEVYPSPFIAYKDNSVDCAATRCPWGDYAGAAPDPRAPRRVWGTNQAVLEWTPSRPYPWTTRVFAAKPSP